MYAAIENITVSRLICYSENEWVLQSKRLSSQVKSGIIKIHKVETLDEAKSLVIPNGPFNEYTSTTNPLDIIIKQ